MILTNVHGVLLFVEQFGYESHFTKRSFIIFFKVTSLDALNSATLRYLKLVMFKEL